MSGMTKQRLMQYSNLLCEVAMLEEQIARCRDAECVSDVVQGSMPQIPYAVHNVSIVGYGSRDIPRLLAQKAKRLQELAAIEAFIEAIPDSALRQLFTRRFIEGYLLRDAAFLVGYSARQARRLIKDCLEKMSAHVR